MSYLPSGLSIPWVIVSATKKKFKFLHSTSNLKSSYFRCVFIYLILKFSQTPSPKPFKLSKSETIIIEFFFYKIQLLGFPHQDLELKRQQKEKEIGFLFLIYTYHSKPMVSFSKRNAHKQFWKKTTTPTLSVIFKKNFKSPANLNSFASTRKNMCYFIAQFSIDCIKI